MTNEPRRHLPERTFQFALRIVTLCQSLDTRPGVARVLARQLLRSGTSVGANVEEGQAAQTEAAILTASVKRLKERRHDPSPFTLHPVLLIGSEPAANHGTSAPVEKAGSFPWFSPGQALA